MVKKGWITMLVFLKETTKQKLDKIVVGVAIVSTIAAAVINLAILV